MAENTPQPQQVETHLTLAVVSLCLSCFSGFLAAAPALASLIFALRADDKQDLGEMAQARKSAKYAQILGWISIALIVLPWVAIFLFVVVFGVGLAGLAAIAA
ncbi:hypothetical protein AAIR98_000358 [Elusimicrobium simillimum]|uniref:CD225/dispanin family protein n=1 Tax=Elusimicrobium simillimum TaxID=3143438 RepID=UPI003C6EFD9B